MNRRSFLTRLSTAVAGAVLARAGIARELLTRPESIEVVTSSAPQWDPSYLQEVMREIVEAEVRPQFLREPFLLAHIFHKDTTNESIRLPRSSPLVAHGRDVRPLARSPKASRPQPPHGPQVESRLS
jgi:hypothetical protein